MNRQGKVTAIVRSILPIIVGISIGFILFLPYAQFKINRDTARCLDENTKVGCLIGYITYPAYAIRENCPITKKEEKGIPKETHNLLVDVYVVNLDNYSDEKIVNLFGEVNSVWKDYGVQFYINNITRIHDDNLKSINEVGPFKFAESVVKDRFYQENDTIIDVIFEEDLHIYNLTINFWFFEWTFERSWNEGQGINENGTNFIWLSTKSVNVSWTLTHEPVHLLGLRDKAYYMREYNLRTHGGCVKDSYYPTLLNQEDVDKVTSQAKFYEHKIMNFS